MHHCSMYSVLVMGPLIISNSRLCGIRQAIEEIAGNDNKKASTATAVEAFNKRLAVTYFRMGNPPHYHRR